MAITRENLYEEVWAEPMITVAKRYNVSSSFLARVCKRMNVPRPARGYWAKLAVGKTSKQPPLPEAQPGDELEWSRDGEPIRAPRKLPQPPQGRRRRKAHPRTDSSGQHNLLVGAREHFDAAREKDDGYLKPQKRLLVDLILSRESLARALESANTLFLALENRGHRVVFSPSSEHFRRATVDPREHDLGYPPTLWCPYRTTVVFVGTVAIGLTLFEIAESVEVRWVDGKYIRVADAPPPKRRGYSSSSWVSKRDLPSGRFCLQAYSPYPRTDWKRQWRESKNGDLANKIPSIVRELEREASTIATLVEEAEHEAELERQRWEAKRLQWAREEAERKRMQALEESREQLFDIIEKWAEAKRVEEFFDDAERRAAEMNTEDNAFFQERLRKARALLGGVDTLHRFRQWKAPDEI
ncbi:hypothetical protein SAMN05660860_00136 [Geoalkalibacter ferrihydriticus]|uniref:Uncharacterized protein n=2 Tax=Geoalkalibacter ferrihydriticus TaxID=392333 RepID=A0A0C2DS21_9BACT|nr:hypothetical protein [Geoalkalibacter ferrihydriticus]KIH76249.1 hypothetical protein GFER_11555 [Geoalkalibacter ferrihydriticus DSM 17813]SDL24515.1 hypothetical protein SAMN05660860_00136 [Geoalkalibacter ferrihydriticus]